MLAFLSTALLIGQSAATCTVQLFSDTRCSGTADLTYSTNSKERWNTGANSNLNSMKVSSDCYRVDFFDKNQITVPPFWSGANYRSGGVLAFCQNNRDINSYEECKEAAAASTGNNIIYAQQVNDKSMPKGCNVRKSDKHVFFNSAQAGRYNPSYDILCNVPKGDYFGGAQKSVLKYGKYQGAPVAMQTGYKCYIMRRFIAGKVGIVKVQSMGSATQEMGRNIDLSLVAGVDMTVLAVVGVVLLAIFACGSVILKKSNVDSADTIAPVIAV